MYVCFYFVMFVIETNSFVNCQKFILYTMNLMSLVFFNKFLFFIGNIGNYTHIMINILFVQYIFRSYYVKILITIQNQLVSSMNIISKFAPTVQSLTSAVVSGCAQHVDTCTTVLVKRQYLNIEKSRFLCVRQVF